MVAAVAGLAALAVVLVQGVVGGTAESVASHSARQEAADLAATELENAWRAHRRRLVMMPEISTRATGRGASSWGSSTLTC